MDKQLEFGLSLLKKGIKTWVLSQDSDDTDIRDDEVCIDKSKLKLCPDKLHSLHA